jgi:hypothetical protein
MNTDLKNYAMTSHTYNEVVRLIIEKEVAKAFFAIYCFRPVKFEVIETENIYFRYGSFEGAQKTHTPKGEYVISTGSMLEDYNRHGEVAKKLVTYIASNVPWIEKIWEEKRIGGYISLTLSEDFPIQRVRYLMEEGIDITMEEIENTPEATAVGLLSSTGKVKLLDQKDIMDKVLVSLKMSPEYVESLENWDMLVLSGGNFATVLRRAILPDGWLLEKLVKVINATKIYPINSAVLVKQIKLS